MHVYSVKSEDGIAIILCISILYLRKYCTWMILTKFYILTQVDAMHGLRVPYNP